MARPAELCVVSCAVLMDGPVVYGVKVQLRRTERKDLLHDAPGKGNHSKPSSWGRGSAKLRRHSPVVDHGLRMGTPATASSEPIISFVTFGRVLTLTIKKTPGKFQGNASAQAQWDYAQVEKAIFQGNEHADAVLVSAESMAEVKRSYLNYFLDVHRFIGVVELATGYTNGYSAQIHKAMTSAAESISKPISGA